MEIEETEEKNTLHEVSFVVDVCANRKKTSSWAWLVESLRWHVEMDIFAGKGPGVTVAQSGSIQRAKRTIGGGN